MTGCVKAVLQIPIKQLAHAAGLPLPAYATDGAAGMDLVAAIEGQLTVFPLRMGWVNDWIENTTDTTIGGNGPAIVPTGICVAIPPGYEGQVRARSGLAAKYGIGIPNGVGTIDSDYRGEIKLILCNWGPEPFTIRRGDRIGQLVVAPVARVAWQQVADLDGTARGEGGFGSTGI